MQRIKSVGAVLTRHGISGNNPDNNRDDDPAAGQDKNGGNPHVPLIAWIFHGHKDAGYGHQKYHQHNKNGDQAGCQGIVPGHNDSSMHGFLV